MEQEVRQDPTRETFFDGKGTVSAKEIDPLLDLLSPEDYAKHIQKLEKKKKKQQDIRVHSNSWFTEFIILLGRSTKIEARDRVQVISSIVQTLFMIVFLGFSFFQLGYDQSDIQARLGVLFFLPTQQLFSTMMPLATHFPEERKIILRERYASTYHISAFYLSRAISIIPLRVIITAVYALSIYYIIGLRSSVSAYFIFLGVLEVSNFTGQSLGLWIGSLSPNVAISQIITPIFLVIMMVYAGQFLNPTTAPPELSWLQYVSLLKWDYSALTQNELKDTVFICTNGELATPEAPCSPGFSTGAQVLQEYDLDTYNITTCCLIILGLAIGFHILAYITLRFTTKPKIRLV
jgi:ABC-type multidrug transport system permease subunit